jgi:hypothetical protein
LVLGKTDKRIRFSYSVIPAPSGGASGAYSSRGGGGHRCLNNCCSGTVITTPTDQGRSSAPQSALYNSWTDIISTWSQQHALLVASHYGPPMHQVGPSFMPPMAPTTNPTTTVAILDLVGEWYQQSLASCFSTMKLTPPLSMTDWGVNSEATNHTPPHSSNISSL